MERIEYIHCPTDLKERRVDVYVRLADGTEQFLYGRIYPSKEQEIDLADVLVDYIIECKKKKFELQQEIEDLETIVEAVKYKIGQVYIDRETNPVGVNEKVKVTEEKENG